MRPKKYVLFKELLIAILAPVFPSNPDQSPPIICSIYKELKVASPDFSITDLLHLLTKL
jgi:hypothetical protein